MLVLHSTERYSSSNASNSAWIVKSVNLSNEILPYIQSYVKNKGNGWGNSNLQIKNKIHLILHLMPTLLLTLRQSSFSFNLLSYSVPSMIIINSHYSFSCVLVIQVMRVWCKIEVTSEWFPIYSSPFPLTAYWHLFPAICCCINQFREGAGYEECPHRLKTTYNCVPDLSKC